MTKHHEKYLRKADEKAIEASKTMVTLESQFLDALRLKSINAARESSHTMTNLMKRAEYQMKKEITRKCDPGLSRYRRQVYLSRQSELIDCYRSFHENLLMMQCEFETRIMRYYSDRYWAFNTTTTFMQSLEASLTTQKEKLKHRILGMEPSPLNPSYQSKYPINSHTLAAGSFNVPHTPSTRPMNPPDQYTILSTHSISI